MAIAENIKTLRLALAMNQREFSDELGVTASMVSLYETGARSPGYKTCRKLIACAKKHGIKLSLDEVRPLD